MRSIEEIEREQRKLMAGLDTRDGVDLGEFPYTGDNYKGFPVGFEDEGDGEGWEYDEDGEYLDADEYDPRPHPDCLFSSVNVRPKPTDATGKVVTKNHPDDT